MRRFWTLVLALTGVVAVTDRSSAATVFDVGFGFMESRALAAAVELGVFEELSDEPLSLAALAERTGVADRGAADFFDALVALDLLEREAGEYRLPPPATQYLDPEGATYAGDFLQFAGRSIYGSWSGLTDALESGEPQAGAPDTGSGDAYDMLLDDEGRLAAFHDAMAGFSALSASAIADRFEWGSHETVCDLGTSKGAFLTTVLTAHPHLSGVGLDLPPIESLFSDLVTEAGLSDRIDFRAADFFEDPLPDADVFVLGHALHNWDESACLALLERVWAALPEDGRLIVYGMIIDDERRAHAHALLMSLNMLVTMESGSGYTFAQCESWLADAGFSETERASLPGPDSMIVAEK